MVFDFVNFMLNPDKLQDWTKLSDHTNIIMRPWMNAQSNYHRSQIRGYQQQKMYLGHWTLGQNPVKQYLTMLPKYKEARNG